MRRIIGILFVSALLAIAVAPAAGQTGTAQTSISDRELVVTGSYLARDAAPVEASRTGIINPEWTPADDVASMIGVAAKPVLVSPAAVSEALADPPAGIRVLNAGDPAYGAASAWSLWVAIELSASLSTVCRPGMANEAAVFYAVPGGVVVIADATRPNDPGVGMTNVISTLCQDGERALFFGQGVGGVMQEFAPPLSAWEFTSGGRTFVVVVLIDPQATVRPVVSSTVDINDPNAYGFEQAPDLSVDETTAMTPAAIVDGADNATMALADGVAAGTTDEVGGNTDEVGDNTLAIEPGPAPTAGGSNAVLWVVAAAALTMLVFLILWRRAAILRLFGRAIESPPAETARPPHDSTGLPVSSIPDDARPVEGYTPLAGPEHDRRVTAFMETIAHRVEHDGPAARPDGLVPLTEPWLFDTADFGLETVNTAVIKFGGTWHFESEFQRVLLGLFVPRSRREQDDRIFLFHPQTQVLYEPDEFAHEPSAPPVELTEPIGMDNEIGPN